MTQANSNLRKIVKLRAQAGAAAEMRTALLELERETRSEPGCVTFEFLQALSDDGAFLLIEDFASTEALDTHMQAPHTRAFFARGLMASGTPIERDWLS